MKEQNMLFADPTAHDGINRAEKSLRAKRKKRDGHYRPSRRVRLARHPLIDGASSQPDSHSARIEAIQRDPTISGIAKFGLIYELRLEHKREKKQQRKLNPVFYS